jgi:SAM-dependent methyltransferase
MNDLSSLYRDRKLSEGYPDLEKLAVESLSAAREPTHEDDAGIERQLGYLGRVADLSARPILVVGCGPKPRMVRFLLQRGYHAIGLEPVPSYVDSARAFLGARERVVRGTAESIPLADRSVGLVYCNSVLEHVDSPEASLEEMFRVLSPGGIACVITTNRWRLSATGDNREFNLPFFNWFPRVVKESYTFHHLHYAPYLANYTTRPAVHWFSYPELCRLGRRAGFAQFYSMLDLIEPDDPPVAESRFKRWLLPHLKYRPWLRSAALAFTHFGGLVVMWKRREGPRSGKQRLVAARRRSR